MLCKYPIKLVKNPEAYSWTRDISAFGGIRQVACGRCSSCRWLMTRQWALRCALEAKMHKQSTFLNLTYSPEHLPENGTLVVKHLQDFVKRLRSFCEYHHNIKIRHYGAGEYGEKKGRAHYHIIIFGYDFPDLKFWRNTGRGFKLYRSEQAEKLWTFGHVEIGSVTFNTAGYVAGYVRKKITGAPAAEWYGKRIPEFAIQSKHPPIGWTWMQANPWVWEEDEIRMAGKSFRPPYPFERMFKKENPEAYAEWVKNVRNKRQRLNVQNRPVDDFADEVETESELE